jgi:hypothetical protein
MAQQCTGHMMLFIDIHILNICCLETSGEVWVLVSFLLSYCYTLGIIITFAKVLTLHHS